MACRRWVVDAEEPSPSPNWECVEFAHLRGCFEEGLDRRIATMAFGYLLSVAFLPLKRSYLDDTMSLGGNDSFEPGVGRRRKPVSDIWVPFLSSYSVPVNQ
jgi:hypothetical protein